MRKEHRRVIGWTFAVLGLGACADGAPTSPRLTANGGPRLAASENVAGGDFTTNNPAVDGANTCSNGPDAASPSVNCNLYGAKRFVWINGGPTNGANALTPGTYFFAVLAPSGQSSPNDGDDDNLSDDYDTYLNRRFTVGADGKITTYIPDANPATPNHNVYNLANPAQLMIRAFPYADTPNPGGVYIMAICRIDVGGYPVDPKQCKYDAFKAQQGLTVVKQIVDIYTVDAFGNMMDAQGNMIPDKTAVIAGGGAGAIVTIPTGTYPFNTKWILYRITVQTHGETVVGTVTLNDNMRPACNLIIATIWCDSPTPPNPHPGLNGINMNKTWTVSFDNTGTFVADFFADLTNTGLCGQGGLDNTAVLTLAATGTTIASNTVPLTINGTCPR
jgi:hypothetical protein